MPKQRITKEMVMDAAFALLREGGEDNVRVKHIAAALSCSVQPIYSYCISMEALRHELSQMAALRLQDYVHARIDPAHPFESTGKAYLSFAKEEPHLFQSYFLRKQRDLHNLDDLYEAEASQHMASYLSKTLSIRECDAKKLHRDMIIYNTGLSFLLIATGCHFPEDELHGALADAYHAFLQAAKTKENEDERNCNL